ncbi:hypothetical protein Ciccas_002919 [Cichlidogyrus casuarinus]|uniref:carnitine O-palmitoyltransferase n=1 Tax=Cichlidogyrus casuarinus TaxID=1844966 RepID=A0ABD2QJ42_9PLAT
MLLDRYSQLSNDRLFQLDPKRTHLISCFAFSAFVWVSGAMLRQYSLKFLFSYQRWIYEVHSGPSLRTKIWAFFVYMLRGGNPGLYSYQSCLPYLPVPAVNDTLRRYIRSVQPLLSKNELDHVTTMAEEFKKKDAKRLQFYLKMKYFWARNYVTDWWEEYVYLFGRAPLMLNSNIYGMDAVINPPTKLQAARAGSVVDLCVKMMHKLVNEELEPTVINGMVPLCSAQFERMFNTTRIPGLQKDTILHIPGLGRYIVVINRGRFFKMPLIYKNKWLDAREYERMLQTILDDISPPLNSEELIPFLTAGERSHWAQTRIDFFSSGLNKESLSCIENAAFVVCLDNDELEISTKDENATTLFARSMLHGTGCDRWFDKSFNIIVKKNARIGFNAEHAWSDAPVMGVMWEDILVEPQEYDHDGHRRGRARSELPTPKRLEWEMSEALLKAIKVSKGVAEKLINDTDHYVLAHDNFGKGFIRAQKISPDAFIQLALQLTYYRIHKSFCLTYEASMTRLFREGRTETVRSCTLESLDFVECMENAKATAKEKRVALVKAAQYHQDLYRDAMTGKGVDRHLFCLYVVAKHLNIESPFLTHAIKQPWKLSTSQTPHGQTKKVLYVTNRPDMVSCGGGFGPVSEDGYGVSYIVAGDYTIFFHISSKLTCPETSSKGFADALCKSMQDMMNIF